MSLEVNFDTLAGPTHHFGGYAFGNIASMEHKATLSNPKAAALQGLEKMKRLHDWGIPQVVLPPRPRPSFRTLRKLGFTGTDAQIHALVSSRHPELLGLVFSSSFMWMANAATVSPSSDTADGRLHLTVANLQSQFHRHLEAEENFHLFQELFQDERLFVIHPPLPAGGGFGDEGAANHLRFCPNFGKQGTHLFVYNRGLLEQKKHHFPFRQVKEASESIARQHGLQPDHVFFARQNPEVIEKGVFHNDVISTGHLSYFLFHERAFLKTDELLEKLNRSLPLNLFCVEEREIPLETAVQSYFFNSQFFSLSSGEVLLLAPEECRPLDLSRFPFRVEYVNLDQSMRGGGGPACQRLRVVMTEEQQKALPPGTFLNETLYQNLRKWIETHYRDNLLWEDLKDPSLLRESEEAFAELFLHNPLYKKLISY